MNELELESRLKDEKMEVASIERRGLAFFIDEILLSLIFFFIVADSGTNFTSPQEVIEQIKGYMPYFIAVKIMYQTFFIYWYGATLGKLALKIRVIESEYLALPTLKESLIRAVIRIASEALFYLGFVVALFSPMKLTWHDRFAKTLVVNV